MKIRTAFPHILERQYPSVTPDSPLLTVLYLLRIREIDAVPLNYPEESIERGVFGFSSLPKFMAKGPRAFVKLLDEPCERASEELASVTLDDDLETLLDAFQARRLGFALVHGVGSTKRRRSFVSLTDVLGLFEGKSISSDLRLNDVATPIYSMPETTSIRNALRQMFRRRYRRIFISAGEFVSDRGIMEYLFSPFMLEQIGWDTKMDVLGEPIAKLEKRTPLLAGPDTAVGTAALKLRRNRGHCIVIAGEKVASPWDVVMKPWAKGKLNIE